MLQEIYHFDVFVIILRFFKVNVAITIYTKNHKNAIDSVFIIAIY